MATRTDKNENLASKKVQTATAGRSRSTSAGNRRRSSRKRPGGFFTALGNLLCLTYFGRVIIILFFLILLSALNLLLSQNQFDLFFRLLGIELILAAVVIWLRFLLRKN